MISTRYARSIVDIINVENFIIERYLINAIPTNRQYTYKYIQKQVGCNLINLTNCISSKLFITNKTNIRITDDLDILVTYTNSYLERLIKKYVYPSAYPQNEHVNQVEKFYDNSLYSSEENQFIIFILEKIKQLVESPTIDAPFLNIHIISKLLNFNSFNNNGFIYIARDIYNFILHNSIHCGDNIRPLINSYQSKTCFDTNFLLKCDLKTNINNFIKNFLNSVFYKINDLYTKIVLLSKLNNNYPFLIKEYVLK